ncbi:MAG: SpoIIE family protein phosphatase [Spirochaetaceae bacterium]|nr:SpoIIE family protein phosphatase [Spirochaetaceae bacterium]MCF7948715.1 SpoIIE family protein phosphatase [Spirochaetia bacterium]MCF7951143.1 SpoIIE family protein phosphatase [Spirochaetaceae bacterium]
MLGLMLSAATAHAQQLYWEEPEVLISEGGRFPRVEQNGGTTAILWHEFRYDGEEPVDMSVSLMVRTAQGDWDVHRRVIGPFDFVGDEVPFASLAIDRDGRVVVATASSGIRLELYELKGPGEQVRQLTTLGDRGGEGISVAPKIFYKEDGGFLLFATKPLSIEATGIGTPSLGINYSVSANGNMWTDFQPLVPNAELSYVYLPSHASYRNREFVVFQASPPESRYYQLYMVSSLDGGRSWTEPRRLTEFTDSLGIEGAGVNNFNNQRPYLQGARNGLHLAWERQFANTTSPQIYYGLIDADGNFIEEPERISSGTASCRSPQVIVDAETPYLLWFDDRKGENRIFLGYRQGLNWQDDDLSIMPGSSMYGEFFFRNNKINVVWENKLSTESRVVMLEPDQSVKAPNVIPQNFRVDERFNQDDYVIEWNIPDDSSGIAGFNYSVDRNPEGRPDRTMKILRRDSRRAEVEVEKDGWWYFHVIARDYAGNWSEPKTVGFFHDTTPPPAVDFTELERDDDGYLQSNTGTISWNPPEAEDLSGYTYRLQYLTGPSFQGDMTAFSINAPPSRIQTRSPEYSFYNLDNGTWALTVAPVDTVGNRGPAETVYFQLNKYIPVTYITRIGVEQDQLNRYDLQIIGRGFSVGGEIQQVMLDRDGEPPYDYVYDQETGLYSVRNDRVIIGPTVENIDEGEYRIGLIHPERGTYFTQYTLQFETTGAVKFGDFTLIAAERPALEAFRQIAIYGSELPVMLIMILLAVMLVFAVWKLTTLAREGVHMRGEVQALLENRQLSYEKKKEKLAAMEKRGMGLRIKFVLLTTFLVLIIVLMVALPLSNYMIRTQQRNLTAGLQENTRVLIESINAGAEKFLPEENTIELGRLPRQMRAAKDARFVTITGPSLSSATQLDNDFYDYLWATNDPEINEKVVVPEDEDVIQAGEFTYERGTVKVDDRISSVIPELKRDINRQAEERVGRLVERLNELQQEAQRAAQRLVNSSDQDTAQLLTELQDQITEINTRIEEELSSISNRMGSIPEFNAENVLSGPTDYTFYRPIVYQDSDREGVYYHGMVRLGISTVRIIEEIRASRETLIRRTALIAFIAIGLGILGALLLATIIIIPIRRLVKGVARIRDTEDKEKLEGHEIEVKTRDEIAILADTVNDMTKGLVNAAIANKDLIIGKEIQKMFIPLEEDKRGRKLTTANLQTEQADFFGYYEGAKGVSGDYFDYMELTPGKYAIVKCDVAGKGVAASLIMVEVATIFRNFFNEWLSLQNRKDKIAAGKGVQRSEEDPNLEELVYAINRLVQERGFKGRFAALIVVLFDVRNGKTVMCNAGDNLVHIFNSEKHAMEAKTLPEAPASGVFPNDLVEMQSGFKRIPHMMKTGDMLLLFTDGLEEAQRKFRNENFEPIVCNEPGLEEGQEHGTHSVGMDNEELSLGRVYDVVNSLMSRSAYKLIKYHNPVPNEELTFDFSSCKGTIQEVVIAMVSVEKVFRMYPDPSAGANDVVVVDRKIDEFLQAHFLQYENYFHHPIEGQTDQEEYVRFSHIKEDQQYDDLTVLGIRKK